MTPKQNLRTLGWSNMQLAAATGVNERTIRRYLKGIRDLPDLTEWLMNAAAWVTDHPPPRNVRSASRDGPRLDYLSGLPEGE